MVNDRVNIPDTVKDREQFNLIEEAINFAGPYQGNTSFGARKSAELSVRFSINSAFGLSKKRYFWQSNSTDFDQTHFTNTQGKIQMRTGATGSDEAFLRSAQVGEYLEHSVAEAGIGMSLDNQNVSRDADNIITIDHGEIWCGNFITDGNNDFYDGHGIRFTPEGVSHEVWREGQQIGQTYQENWNIDPLDGTGRSGRVFQPEEGYVYQFIYTWYGEGPVILAVESPDGDDVIPVHKYTTESDAGGDGHFSQANGPLAVSVDNDGTAESLGCLVGGIQYCVYGDASEASRDATRETNLTRRTTGSTIVDNAVVTNGQIDARAEPGTPLLSVKRDETDPLTAEGLAIEVQENTLNVASDCFIFVWDEYEPDTALTGANFQSPQGIENDESKLLVDSSATDYTPTEAVLRGVAYVPSGKKEATDVSGNVSADIPINGTIVATAVLDVGQNTTDAQPFLLPVQERW